MAENNASCKAGDDDKDDELNQLLESAIEDFDRPNTFPGEVNGEKNEDARKGSGESWGEEFLGETPDSNEMKLFAQKMNELFSQDVEQDPNAFIGQFEEQLQKLADEANKVLTEHSKQDPEFSATISQTLKNLSDDAENLRSQLGPEALSTMLNGLGLGESTSPNDLAPLMQNMMQTFLSKEVFYPSLKEITEKYPAWLEKEKDNLSPEDFQNYSKQMALMDEVCSEFEKESSTDSEDTKKKRFTKILSLMEDMQKLGHPPKEFIGDTPFNENGMPFNLPGMDPSQCSIM